MNKYSQSEAEIIHKLIVKDSYRLDNRNFDEKREYKFSILDLPFYDMALNVKNGNTEINVYFTFKEKYEVVQLENKQFVENKQPTENKYHFFLTHFLRKILQNSQLECVINFDILKNDGNLLSTLLNGLNFILQNFTLPNLPEEYNLIKNENLLSLTRESNTVGASSIAMFDNHKIMDPTLLEEISADHLLTAICINSQKMVHFESKDGLSIDEVNKCILS